MPFVRPFETAGGREDDKDCILVRAWAGGISGWGESPVPMTPFYMEETVETAWPIITRFLAPRVLGRAFTHPAEIATWLRPIRRHRFAKSGLEAAAWDLYAQDRGVSIAQALGGTR